jgi:thiol:disulfide interchange protein DsbD
VTRGANNTYKITFHATIQSTWHIYSQVQPKNAIAQPLVLSFNGNPQVALQGRSIEVGRLIKGFDKATKIEDHHYSKTLEVYQLAKRKSGSKTKLSGVLTYQTCNNKQCLAPEDYDFSVILN